MVLELEKEDGALSFDEAVGRVNGLKLQGPETRPTNTDRPASVTVGDLPVRFLDSISGKVAQFCFCNININNSKHGSHTINIRVF